MHSTFFFLIDLEEGAPRSGQALFDHAVSIFEDRYGHRLDENNWWQQLYVTEKDGQQVKLDEIEGEVPSFEAAWRQATGSVLSSLSMYGRPFSGESSAVFLDVNPMSIGPRGQDEGLVGRMDQKTLSELIFERGSRYLAARYKELAEGSMDDRGLSDYQRASFARIFELFLGSSDRPFSGDLPNPYEYPAVDLRYDGLEREVILAVDIHT